MNTPEKLLEHFFLISPQFGKYWQSEDNYNVNDDGSFSFCGVCNEFAYYLLEDLKKVIHEVEKTII